MVRLGTQRLRVQLNLGCHDWVDLGQHDNRIRREHFFQTNVLALEFASLGSNRVGIGPMCVLEVSRSRHPRAAVHQRFLTNNLRGRILHAFSLEVGIFGNAQKILTALQTEFSDVIFELCGRTLWLVVILCIYKGFKRNGSLHYFLNVSFLLWDGMTLREHLLCTGSREHLLCTGSWHRWRNAFIKAIIIYFFQANSLARLLKEPTFGLIEQLLLGVRSQKVLT